MEQEGVRFLRFLRIHYGCDVRSENFHNPFGRPGLAPLQYDNLELVSLSAVHLDIGFERGAAVVCRDILGPEQILQLLEHQHSRVQSGRRRKQSCWRTSSPLLSARQTKDFHTALDFKYGRSTVRFSHTTFRLSLFEVVQVKYSKVNQSFLMWFWTILLFLLFFDHHHDNAASKRWAALLQFITLDGDPKWYGPIREYTPHPPQTSCRWETKLFVSEALLLLS